MISAGQTQNIEAPVTQSPPPSLGTITPLVCSNSLAEEKLTQCTNRLTDVYTVNWSRTPENLRSVFEGFAELAVNSFFTTCSTLQSTPQTIGQCMFDAFIDGNILMSLWNTDFTLSEFLVRIADILSGDVCTHAPTSAEGGVLTGMSTYDEQHAYMHEHHICHDEGVVSNPFADDITCRIANSRDLAAMIALQSDNEKNAYMHERQICHRDFSFELGDPTQTPPQQIVTNPWGGSNPWE